MKDIKSKITGFFSTIRNFNILASLFYKKIKGLKNDLKTNKELILYHEDRIKIYKNVILDSEERIENFKKENVKIGFEITYIKKIK